MDLKINIICLLFIFNLVSLNHTFAFFQNNDHPDVLHTEHTPSDQSTQDNNLLYLYDNFSSSTSRSYLTKKRGDFVFADQINIKIPMNILMHDSIYPENSIDRMMLANLRVKKLLDEYAELQKKAGLILQTSVGQGEKKDKNINLDEESEAIHKTISHIGLLGRLSKETDPEQTPIAKPLSSNSDAVNDLEKNIISYTPSSDDTGNTRGSDYKGQQSILRKESHELPWILNLLLKLLNYIVTNRLEIILNIIFITIIGFFISLKIKK